MPNSTVKYINTLPMPDTTWNSLGCSWIENQKFKDCISCSLFNGMSDAWHNSECSIFCTSTKIRSFGNGYILIENEQKRICTCLGRKEKKLFQP